jgi:hypothetical protein
MFGTTARQAELADGTSRRALIVAAVESGLWRVSEEGGDKLLDVFSKPAAVRFAEGWAQSYGAGQIRIYDGNGELEHIVVPRHLKPDS